LKGENKMLEAVGTGITSVIGWIGDVITALTTTEGELAALLPLFAVGIAISAVLLGVKVIKSLVWGA
jgi:hypothetical protein